MIRTLFWSTLFSCFHCLNPALAHPHDGDSTDAHAVAATVERDEPSPPAILLPRVDGPAPWSDAPVLNNPNRFHIAIMTDRTGGHRPGIWMKGVRAVNLLRPEFVVSVGDLIEGYSEDRARVEAEWKEFLAFIEQLDMKFFFVAGNHDVTNPTMHAIWREHFGREWYSFDYKGVHFVCLCSEDPESRIGDEQLAWIEEDLAKNRDARWTLVFLHKPLWAHAQREINAGNPDSTNWSRVENLLGSRPHTVFAGHVHHYVQYDRRGNKYFSLATTGGGSQLRGSLYGEFDHVVWLTMESDGPHVANLMLDGVQPADVVTEHGIARFRNFLANTVIEIAPIWVDDGDEFSDGRIDLRVTNRFDLPIELKGRIAGLPLKGLTLEPADLALTAQPGETVELALGLRFTDPVELTSLSRTLLTATVRTIGGDRPLAAEWTVPVTIDQKYAVPLRTAAAEVNELLDDWDALRFSTSQSPRVLGAASEWQGPGDASMEFDVAEDTGKLVLAGRVTDDVVMEGDGVEVWLDARPLAARASDTRLRGQAYTFNVAPPKNGGDGSLEVLPHRSPPASKRAAAASKKTDKGYDFKLEIPAEMLAAGGDWKSVQLTVVIRDMDEEGHGAARVLWRGAEDFEQRNTNYGQFVREAAPSVN